MHKLSKGPFIYEKLYKGKKMHNPKQGENIQGAWE